MTGDTIPYETIEEFYEGLTEQLSDIMQSFKKESRVKRTITVPKTFDDVLHRVIRADLLKFLGVEVTYSDLLAGFAMFGFAKVASKEVVNTLSGKLDFLDAYDKAKLKKEQER